MSNVAIKLIAVSGVVGLGLLMFLQAQKGIQTTSDEGTVSPLEVIDGSDAATASPDTARKISLAPGQSEPATSPEKIPLNRVPSELLQVATRSATPLENQKKKTLETPFAPNTNESPSKIKLVEGTSEFGTPGQESAIDSKSAKKITALPQPKGLDFRDDSETESITPVENPFSESFEARPATKQQPKSASSTAQPELKTEPVFDFSSKKSEPEPFDTVSKTTIPPRENMKSKTISKNPFDEPAPASTRTQSQSTGQSKTRNPSTPVKGTSSPKPFEFSEKSETDTPTLDSNPFITTPESIPPAKSLSKTPPEKLTPEVDPEFNPFGNSPSAKSPTSNPVSTVKAKVADKKSEAKTAVPGQPVIESSPFEMKSTPKPQPVPQDSASDVVVIKKRKEVKTTEPPLFTIEGGPAKTNASTQQSVKISPTPEPKQLSRVEGNQPVPKETAKLDVQQKIQSPKMTIQKMAPPEAVLGQPFIYHVLVKNVGTTSAQEVIVEDRIPHGANLTGTIPRAEQINNRIIWRLGTMGPGEEKKISIRVIPEESGQIGSVATVNFATKVAAETNITAPKLVIKSDQPGAVKPGDITVVNYSITNSGTGDAKNVYVRSIIPPQFTHPGGDDLEYSVGIIPAGETKQIQLKLKAVKPGAGKNISSVIGDGNIKAETEVPLKVIGTSEKILLTRKGPKNRYLGRSGTYENVVTNNSETPIQNISVFESVPPGMKFVTASAQGQFDPVRKVVQWDIPNLAASDRQVLTVELEPLEVGKQISTVQVVIDNSSKFSANLQSETTIIGQPLLKVETSELKGPLEVGEKMVMQVQLKNQGSASATNVEFRVKIPQELVFLSATGPVQYKQAGSYVIFEPTQELPAKQVLDFELSLTARTKGDARVLVQVQSKQMEKPLSKEEAVPVLEKLQ